MGALHSGHISLVESAASECDLAVSSVFVNPAQFAPGEDFDSYPRQLDRDLELLENAGISAVFAPSAEEMYPKFPPSRTFVDPAEANDGAEGRRRPGFFRGVATVVTKLLNVVQPDFAYFGQKDGYQCIVVRQLCRDLMLPTRVRVMPTVRDSDGLAKSSRNAYLTDEQRSVAPGLYRGLQQLQTHVEGLDEEARRDLDLVTLSGPEGELHEMFKRAIGGLYKRESIEYIDWSCALTGRPLSRLADSAGRGGAVLLSAAVKVGSTRLIDNVIVGGTPDDLGAA